MTSFLNYYLWSTIAVCVFRYKKNIKALYVVHPTMFVKTLLFLLKPIFR